jgi:4-amino-4-deoxy-L-arabinose transferase-like glycosyltransferase
VPTADYVIAGVAVFFFLAAALVNYFLAKMLFDRRLAVVGLLMMLLCDRFWEFATTGLPQMLMLFLFSLALLLYAKALAAKEIGSRVWPWAIGVGLCFGLLALSHAITLFLLLGCWCMR